MENKVEILGVSFSKLSMEQTVQWISKIVAKPYSKVYHIITANPEIVIGANEDPSIKDITQSADLITPDGIGIVMASRWNQDPVSERVAGYDLLLRLLKEGNMFGWSFYFLGSSEEVNREATDKIQEKYPNIKIAGRHHGFLQGTEEEVVDHIRQTSPDILFVALGAPRQEQWIYRYKHQLGAKVAIGVGGSFDVIAGKVKRAPVVWQKLNLEWLYRLLSQPSRWRRQLALPKFAIQAYLEARRKISQK